MSIKVTPTITIGGRVVACHTAALEREPVAIRGLEVSWGRSSYHDSRAEPSSMTVHIADATGEWARRIREGTAIGMKIEGTWLGTPTTSTAKIVGPVKFFRGRIAAATAEPMDRRTSEGAEWWEITLTCADRTADLGNALAGGEWPRETMLARAVRIRDLGLAGGSEIEQVYFDPDHVPATCAPLDTRRASALDLMGDLYRSMGADAWGYDPDENVVRQAIRLSQPLSVHLGSFDDDLGAVYPVVSDIIFDKKTYPGVSLGGCELGGVPKVAADPAAAINRVECTWHDWSTDHGQMITTRDAVSYGDARRVMSWESWLDDGIYIDPSVERVWSRVREEGARPRHPDLRTRPTFKFATGRLARWLLQTWENTRPAYIAGSMAYQWLMGDIVGYAPIVAPIGGVTRFDPERGWSVELHVHWIHNETPPPSAATWTSLQQHRVSYSSPSVPWWWSILGLPTPPPVAVGERTPDRDMTWGEASAGAGYRFAGSVTWGDMRHVPTDGTSIIDHLE